MSYIFNVDLMQVIFSVQKVEVFKDKLLFCLKVVWDFWDVGLDMVDQDMRRYWDQSLDVL